MTDSGLVQLRQKIAQAELGLAVQELASHKKDAEVASLRSQLAARLWEQTKGENKAKLLQKQQLEHLRAELFAERAAISALNLEIKQAKAKAGGGDVNPELTVLVEEADNWKDKYDDLLENVARLEGRMGRILTKKVELEERLALRTTDLETKTELTTAALEKVEKWKRKLSEIKAEKEDKLLKLDSYKRELAECQDLIKTAQEESLTPDDRLVREAALFLQKLVPYLGVELTDDEASGKAKVLRVTPRGPADYGGLLNGDVIEMAQSKAVATRQDFEGILLTVTPGSTLILQVQRKQKSLEVVVEVENELLQFNQIDQLRRISSGDLKQGDEAFMKHLTQRKVFSRK
mmetsp:Transcript_15836/g.30991  ORF Transcript_15836/g.30991 Transcript_15836/m.30991 type:complete len:348 (+) Transcript_15836:40-1083(+)